MLGLKGGRRDEETRTINCGCRHKKRAASGWKVEIGRNSGIIDLMGSQHLVRVYRRD
jgi:hypothetical protein